MKTKILVLTLVISALFFAACAGEKAAEREGMGNSPANNKPADAAAPIQANFVSDAEAVKTALNVGAKMPSFTLKNIGGKPVSSDYLLKKGNLENYVI